MIAVQEHIVVGITLAHFAEALTAEYFAFSFAGFSWRKFGPTCGDVHDALDEIPSLVDAVHFNETEAIEKEYAHPARCMY